MIRDCKLAEIVSMRNKLEVGEEMRYELAENKELQESAGIGRTYRISGV